MILIICKSYEAVHFLLGCYICSCCCILSAHTFIISFEKNVIKNKFHLKNFISFFLSLHQPNLQFSGVVRYARALSTTEGHNKLLNMSTAATGSRNMEANEMALLSNILATYTFIEGESSSSSM